MISGKAHIYDYRTVHTGHPMRIELDQIQFECVHTECAFARGSGLIPIHFQRWFQLHNCMLCVRIQKGVACMLMSTTDSEHDSPGYTLCSIYLLNSRSNMMAG